LGFAIGTKFSQHRINPVKAGARHHADVKGVGLMHAVGGLYSEECDNTIIVTKTLI
jgi:23S rRNA maturation-related 3'-5' exoribonuclease YhaM